MKDCSLSTNPFLASIQLLFWLLFRPAAWQALVAQIDSALPSDFALSTLRLKQWRHPVLLRLLGLIYITGPLVIGIIVGIVGLYLWWVNGDIVVAIRGLIYVMTLSIVGGLTSGITVSVAFSYVASLVGALGVGLFFWMEDEQWYRAAILSGVFAISLASSVLLSLAHESDQFLQKNDGLVIGSLVTAVIFSGAVVVSGAILIGSIYVIYYIISPFATIELTDIQPQMIGLAVGMGFLFGLFTRRWIWAAILTLVFALTMSLLITEVETQASLNILVKPVIGGISNGLLFALLFVLPYLLARYILNPWAGIVAGLLGSGGVYVIVFIWRQPDIPILLWSLIAASLGLSQQKWQQIRRFFMDNPLNHWHRIRRFWQRIREHMPQLLGKWLHGFTQLAQSEKRVELLAQFLKHKLHTVSRQLAETTSDGKIDNPYITGVPLTKHNKNLFVGRTDISARIEVLLRNQPSPPLLLHGQRRIGKTSLLNFLSELPDSYVPLFVDFQGVSLATNNSGFFYNISRACIRSARDRRQLSLPPINREALQDDPFTEFDEWLDRVEESVEGRVLLLTFDEFEALEGAFNKGSLDKDFVLGVFRHIIQHRWRFKIIIAGVHRLDIFPDWASYLINTESVHLSYLEKNEAKQLIEKPIKNSLRYAPQVTEFILALTHCHPALIQLLCKEIVFLKNQQDSRVRNLVQKTDVEAAIGNAFKSGKNFFNHVTNRSDAEQAVLRFLAAQGEGAIVSQQTLAEHCEQDSLENILSSLVQYELIESTDKGYRFQVEFIRRWFTENRR